MWSLSGCGGGKKSSADAGAQQCAQGTYFSCIGPAGCNGTQMCVNGLLTSCDCGGSAGSVTPGSGANVGAGAGAGGHGGAGGATGGAAMGSGGSPGSGGTSGGATGGTSGGMAGTTSPPPSGTPEDCSNGVDDDGDGKVDCADGDCMTWTCTPQAPDGWMGPVVLYDGSDKPPSCDGSYTQVALRGGSAVSADAAQCSTCTCSGSTSCASYLSFGASSNADCSSAGCSSNVATNCSELASTCLAPSTVYVQTQLPLGQTSCSASAQSPSITDAAFSKYALGCGATSAPRRGGCGPSNVCAPPKPFMGPLCIVKSGDQACPSGDYSDKHVYYTAIDDTRDCSACSCDQDCAYSWQVFDDADTACATPLATKNAANECITVTPNSGKIRVGVSISGAGGCTAHGGQPTGGATPSAPYTACCKP